jgi:phage/plasmid-associated DNA primase
MAELHCPRTPEELAELVDETTGAEQDDGSWVITCPAHDDRNPSLVVSLGERGRMKNRLLVHCRAGCSYRAVQVAFGVMGIDIDPPRNRKTAKQRAATARLELDVALGGVLGPEQAQEPTAADSEEPTAADSEEPTAADSEEPKEAADSEVTNDRVQFQALERIWMAAGDIIGTPGERYLIEHRRLPDGGPWQAAIAGGFTLRFSAGDTLPTKGGSVRQLGPMILARITMPAGQVCGFQIILLAADGKKAGSFIVGKVPPGVAAIRLCGNAIPGGPLPALVLAEGLETGLSRLVPGLPGPVILEVVCGSLPTAVEKRVDAMARLLLKQGTGSPDYSRVWSRIELLVDRDKVGDMTIPAQMLNAASGLTVAQLVAPAGLGGRNADLNDVLQTAGAGGVGAVWLDGLLTALRPGECLLASKGQEVDLAKGLVDRTWRSAAGRTHLSVDNAWYAWSATDKRWRSEDDVEVLNDVQSVLSRSFEVGEHAGVTRWANTNTRLVEQVARRARGLATEPTIQQLAGRCYQLDRKRGAVELPDSLLCQGGLMLDLITRAVQPVDQTVFGLSIIAADPMRLAETPERFERVMREAFTAVPDYTEEDVAAQLDRAYEMLGYGLIGGRFNLQKLFFLLGAPGTGKSLLAKVLGALLGDALGTTSFSSLDETFGLAPLVGRSALLISDARSMGWHGVGGGRLAIERILGISGGDSVLVNPKNKPAFSAVLTQCLFILANTLPSALIDPHGALARRVTLLAFDLDDARGPADSTLEAMIIEHELPGILGRALDGLDRLRRYRSFTTSAGIQRNEAALIDRFEPLRVFARHVEVSPGSYLTRTEIYAAYLCWAKDNGMRRELSTRSFFDPFRQALKAVGVPVKSGALRGVRLFRDVRWSDQMPEEFRKGTPRMRAVITDLDDALNDEAAPDAS